MSVGSNFVFALVLLSFALWLVAKICTTFSTNENQNQNQSCLARTLFPALGTGYMYLLRILIGPLYCLRLLWLVGWLVGWLGLRHSIETALKALHTNYVFNVLTRFLFLRASIGFFPPFSLQIVEEIILVQTKYGQCELVCVRIVCL